VSDFDRQKEKNMDFYGFYTGTEFEAYKYLGHHFTENGVLFRVYAPAAQKVCLIGQFNSWQEQEMKRIHDGHFFECYNSDAKNGDL
jgi:1,4-alpha-glucan branching enzyme